MLEDSNSDIQYEEEQIVITISQYFNGSFTSANRDCSSTVGQALQPRVTEAMNEQLIKLPIASKD